MSTKSSSSALAISLVLGLGVLSGCAGDETSESGTTTAGTGETTSGGEATGRTGELEQPPGSVAPEEHPEAQTAPDPQGGTTQGQAAGTQPGGATQPAQPDAPRPSRWGARAAEACQGADRPPMSAAARSQIQRGIAAANSGDAAGARTAFQAALSADPRSYHAAYNLGVASDRAGDETQAMEFYRQSLRIQPDYEEAVRGMVRIFIRRDQASQALRFVEPIARAHRNNLHLQAIHAEVLVHNNRHEAAWDAARVALRCDERFVPALRALVKASIAQERKELAESILDDAIAAAPNDPELHYLRATMLEGQPGRSNEVMAELRRAAELRPSYAEARMELGLRLLRSGNYPEALTHFQAVSQLTPGLVAVHLALGDTHRSAGQWQEAKTAYDRVTQMNPNLPEVYFNLGLMYQTALENFPGLNTLQALERAQQNFTRYRDLMGPRLSRDDPSEEYLRVLDRQIRRTRRAMEEEAREAERAAREAEGGGDAGDGDGDGDDDEWM